MKTKISKETKLILQGNIQKDKAIGWRGLTKNREENRNKKKWNKLVRVIGKKEKKIWMCG